MTARVPLPLPPALLALLVLAFAAPGLANHDPWKAFDAIGVEIVHQMHLTGDWLVPRVAGEPWLDEPPLYYWAALAFAKAFGGILEFHNAARLASGACVLAAAWFLHRGGGAVAPLVLVGSVGLMVHAHEACPDLAALAFTSIALTLLVRVHEHSLRNGVLLGGAIGGVFLATGFAAALALVAAAAAAFALSPDMRSPRARAFIAAALAVAAALMAIWPLALILRAPDLAQAWWQAGARAHGDLGANLQYFLSVSSWFAWPAWPLAAWSLWVLRRRLREPALLVPLAATATMFAAIVAAGPARDVNAIALLAPLALLAAPGVAQLRRGAGNALDWFGVMTFGFFASLVWLGWIAMQTGAPARIARNFAKTAPGFEAQFDPLGLAFALALSLAWMALAVLAAPAPARSVTRWAAGVVLLWGVFSSLWMPWADYQKSYRSVALELRKGLPRGHGCIAQRNLGAPQHAALSYHAGIRAQAFDPANPEACRLLVVQGNPRQETDVPGRGWVRIAEAGRPGDRQELFRLYALQ